MRFKVLILLVCCGFGLYGLRLLAVNQLSNAKEQTSLALTAIQQNTQTPSNRMHPEQAIRVLAGLTDPLTSDNAVNGRSFQMNFSSMDMKFAYFPGAYLDNINWTSANLTMADFRFATLSRIDFTGANLTWVNLAGASICQSIMPDGSLCNRKCISQPDLCPYLESSPLPPPSDKF